MTPAPRSRFAALLGALAWGHLWVGALVEAGVVAALGGPLAMWWAMLAGVTEPATPSLPYPWALSVLTWLLPAPWVHQRRWRAATLVTLPAVVVPFLHFLRLYSSISP